MDWERGDIHRRGIPSSATVTGECWDGLPGKKLFHKETSMKALRFKRLMVLDGILSCTVPAKSCLALPTYLTEAQPAREATNQCI
jgi:hypothetical protein